MRAAKTYAGLGNDTLHAALLKPCAEFFFFFTKVGWDWADPAPPYTYWHPLPLGCGHHTIFCEWADLPMPLPGKIWQSCLKLKVLCSHPEEDHFPQGGGPRWCSGSLLHPAVSSTCSTSIQCKWNRKWWLISPSAHPTFMGLGREIDFKKSKQETPLVFYLSPC